MIMNAASEHRDDDDDDDEDDDDDDDDGNFVISIRDTDLCRDCHRGQMLMVIGQII